MNNKISLNLEMDKLIQGLIKNNAKTVLVQLPDGLKPKALEIKNYVEKQIPNIKLTFWAGSCYGSCDTPNVNYYDLFVQFGHSSWR